jgi:FtsZ-binding cell division protein ZapB
VPVTLDRKRSTEIGQLVSDKGNLELSVYTANQRIRSLSAEVEELKKPRRTVAQERDYQEVKAHLENCTEHEITTLRHLRKVEEVTQTDQSGLSSLPPKFTRDMLATSLTNLHDKRLITRRADDFPDHWKVTWCIADWAKPHLEELL